MRKIILFMAMSLDGFIADAQGGTDWEGGEEGSGEVEGKYLIPDLLRTVDTMLLGRVLFQGFEQAWPAMAKDPSSPKELVEFANWIEDSPKIVFSKTLDKIGWKNAKLVQVKTNGDILKEVKKIKQQSGGDIVVFGGVQIAQTLARLGLIDEYRLKVQPIILVRGKPLFTENEKRVNLKLIKHKTFDSGVVALYYQPIIK